MAIVAAHAALPLLEENRFDASSVGLKIKRRLCRLRALPRLMGMGGRCRDRGLSRGGWHFGSSGYKQHTESNPQQCRLRFAKALHSQDLLELARLKFLRSALGAFSTDCAARRARLQSSSQTPFNPAARKQESLHLPVHSLERRRSSD